MVTTQRSPTTVRELPGHRHHGHHYQRAHLHRTCQRSLTDHPTAACGSHLRRKMGKLDGRVAFITGAARGQGRSHAIRLAEEGADIIAIDICAPIEAASYGTATPADLEETIKEVEGLGRRIVASHADVRDVAALQKAFDDGATALGPVDIVVANAGIGAGGFTVPEEQQWEEVVGVNMTGVWNTGRVAIPSMLKRNQGGSIILTSSTGGLIGVGIP